MNEKDSELVNKEFRHFNNIIIELEEEATWLRRLLILAGIIIIAFVCTTNYILTGSVL